MPALSSSVVTEADSWSITGASFSAETTTDTVMVAVSEASLTATSKLSEPLKAASGVYVTTPSTTVAEPFAAPELMLQLRSSPSTSVALSDTVPEVSSVVLISADSCSMVGTSFTGVTVTATVISSDREPSDTLTVKLSEPLKSAFGT